VHRRRAAAASPAVQLALCLAAPALLLPHAARALVDCSVTAAGVAFGVYDSALTSPTDSVGNVRVRCVHLSGGAEQVNYTVSLSTGNSGTYALRRLRAGTSVLPYNLFGDPSRLQVWGNGSAGTFVAAGSHTVGPGVGNGSRETLHPIYGRIPAQQDAPPGSYSDAILLTLSF
jgi:spore coat protein U-like protein